MMAQEIREPILNPVVGGIEAGGTKFVCAVGTGPEDVRAEARFSTTDPETTIGEAISFFRQHAETDGELTAIGIASFGPVDPHRDSPAYGYITSTPKSGWANTDFAGQIGRALGLPVGFDTDVNGAALGEWRWGAARGLNTFIYLTVGTGIGGGAMVNRQLLHGLVHPEMGHIRLPHNWERDPYPGRCPYHGDCLEGMASGPALADRWGKPAEQLPPEHEAWVLEAEYLAYALVNFIVTLSPERIILGGGVMEQPGLLAAVRERVRTFLGGYVRHPQLLEHIEHYIVSPGLGNRAGVLGAFALAQREVGSGVRGA